MDCARFLGRSDGMLSAIWLNQSSSLATSQLCLFCAAIPGEFPTRGARLYDEKGTELGVPVWGVCVLARVVTPTFVPGGAVMNGPAGLCLSVCPLVWL